MKTKTKGIRDRLILKILNGMLKLHSRVYTNKRVSWGIKREELIACPPKSLGNELGKFLLKENFHSIPMIERHDVFHLLFGFNTQTKDEVAMLCFLVGNGKVTLFTTLSAIGAVLVYPERLPYFIYHFHRGRNALNVSKWDFRPFLNENMKEVRDAIFLKRVPYSSVLNKIKVELSRSSYQN